MTSRGASRDNSQETLSTLASDTGGRLFVDDNDLSLGMQKARDDISSYYILGYYSTNGKMDGKYRRVQIKLNNNIQAKLDYKSGYFGEKDFKKFNSSDKESQLEQALMLGDPLTDLSLSGELDYFRLARDRYFVPFSVKIPGAEIALAKSKGKAQTEFEFIGQLRDDHTKLVGMVRDGIKIKLAEQTAAQLASHPIAYGTGFTVAPGTYTLKFLARENETGKMGTYETKFVIPDLAPDKPALLKTSSVIWSSQRQPITESHRVRRRRRRFSKPIRWCRTARNWSPASRTSSAKTRTFTCTWRCTIRVWMPVRSPVSPPRFRSIAARRRASNRSPCGSIRLFPNAGRRCRCGSRRHWRNWPPGGTPARSI